MYTGGKGGPGKNWSNKHRLYVLEHGQVEAVNNMDTIRETVTRQMEVLDDIRKELTDLRERMHLAEKTSEKGKQGDRRYA